LLLFGLGIYLLVLNTTLSLRAGTCCFFALILAVSIIRWLERDEDDDDVRMVWLAAGVMTVSVSELVITYGQMRHWPSGPLHLLNTVTDWVLVPAAVLLATVLLLTEWPAPRRWLRQLFARR